MKSSLNKQNQTECFIAFIYKLQYSKHFKSIQTKLMADVIKVKAKKQFEWEQDNKYIFVKVSMPGHTSIKNLQIYLSDLILRITSKIKKSVQTVDLAKEIDYLSAENKFVLIDGVVNATLKKKVAGEKWTSLVVEDISLAELKARRKQSQARYEKSIKQVEENKEKLKSQYDRMATKQLMRFEEEERKKLEKKKQAEKQAALNEVFRNVNENTGKIQSQSEKWNQKSAKQLQRLQKQQEEERLRQKQQRKKAQQQKYLKQLHNQLQQKSKHEKSQKNSMFTEQDVKDFDKLRNNIEEQIQQIPVRKEAKVNVKFTQKLYPNVATRDYHYTQPPMPKGAAPIPPPREGDLQNRNPLWLKDRGDGFMKHKNYSAALDAYTQAIKIDPSQRKILMNRSLAHMKLFNLDAAIHDCDTILLQMQKQIINSQQNANQSLQDLIKIKARKGLCLAWKGKLKQAKQLLTEQLTFPIDSSTKAQIQSCIQIISKRQQSISTKLKGDECVKRQAYEEAINYYNKSIEVDRNQYSLSNKCLCLNKTNKFEQSIENADEAIKIVQQFVNTTSLVASDNKFSKNAIENTSLLMKLLYRKSVAQQNLKQLKESESTLKKALTINPEDKDIKTALSSLKSRQSSEQLIKLKDQASKQLTQNNNPQQALKIYSKCLKILETFENASEYLSILQNQCVCYLKLQQYDSVISNSIRILNIVNNMKNKIVQFGQKKASIPKDTLNKIAVRTLLRRAQAYLKTSQNYNAKSDLEKAVEIEPNDQNIVKQLEQLKEKLKIS